MRSSAALTCSIRDPSALASHTPSPTEERSAPSNLSRFCLSVSTPPRRVASSSRRLRFAALSSATRRRSSSLLGSGSWTDKHPPPASRGARILPVVRESCGTRGRYHVTRDFDREIPGSGVVHGDPSLFAPKVIAACAAWAAERHGRRRGDRSSDGGSSATQRAAGIRDLRGPRGSRTPARRRRDRAGLRAAGDRRRPDGCGSGAGARSRCGRRTGTCDRAAR